MNRLKKIFQKPRANEAEDDNSSQFSDIMQGGKGRKRVYFVLPVLLILVSVSVWGVLQTRGYYMSIDGVYVSVDEVEREEQAYIDSLNYRYRYYLSEDSDYPPDHEGSLSDINLFDPLDRDVMLESYEEELANARQTALRNIVQRKFLAKEADSREIEVTQEMIDEAITRDSVYTLPSEKLSDYSQDDLSYDATVQTYKEIGWDETDIDNYYRRTILKESLLDNLLIKQDVVFVRSTWDGDASADNAGREEEAVRTALQEEIIPMLEEGESAEDIRRIADKYLAKSENFPGRLFVSDVTNYSKDDVTEIMARYEDGEDVQLDTPGQHSGLLKRYDDDSDKHEITIIRLDGQVDNEYGSWDDYADSKLERATRYGNWYDWDRLTYGISKVWSLLV